jgi:hypothetical protein
VRDLSRVIAMRLILVVIDGSGRYEMELPPTARPFNVPIYAIFTPQNIAQIKQFGKRIY